MAGKPHCDRLGGSNRFSAAPIGVADVDLEDHLLRHPDGTAVPCEAVLAVALPVEALAVESAVVRVARRHAVVDPGRWRRRHRRALRAARALDHDLLPLAVELRARLVGLAGADPGRPASPLLDLAALAGGAAVGLVVVRLVGGADGAVRGGAPPAGVGGALRAALALDHDLLAGAVERRAVDALDAHEAAAVLADADHAEMLVVGPVKRRGDVPGLDVGALGRGAGGGLPGALRAADAFDHHLPAFAVELGAGLEALADPEGLAVGQLARAADAVVALRVEGVVGVADRAHLLGLPGARRHRLKAAAGELLPRIVVAITESVPKRLRGARAGQHERRHHRGRQHRRCRHLDRDGT